ERCSFAEGSEGDDGGAAGVDHPLRVLPKEVVIDTQVFAERRRDRGDDPLPVHSTGILKDECRTQNAERRTMKRFSDFCVLRSAFCIQFLYRSAESCEIGMDGCSP